MEGPVWKAQMFGVGFEAGNLLSQTTPGDFLQAFDKHGMVQIGSNDAAVGPHAGFDQEGEIGCAGPDIECPAFSGHRDMGSSNFFPPISKSKTQKRVFEVENTSDRLKHPLNGLSRSRASP